MLVSKKQQEDQRDQKTYIKYETSRDFRNALLALTKGAWSEDRAVLKEEANKDARALYEAGEKREDTDCTVFIDMLTSRSTPQLRKGFELYSILNTIADMAKAIDLELKGDIENFLVAIKLNLAMKGSGYRGNILTCIMVSHSELNLVNKGIKARPSLRTSFLDDTKGDYENILLALCRNDQQNTILSSA
ncbi:annexin A1-like isoform X1 [Astyanax mexicanus]|uniref:Annexin A1-like isoform X1 n=1 Tax=Astyanax mexicanus TaxID=7994 RepID=A0A8T2MDF1_ASTMX|nr:annexin A1-like isoform X1 [Astyanax mexicanus]